MVSNKIISEIDASDISERLVGITPIYLQRFIQRGLYGLRASLKSGKVRAQRRSFSRDDVFGIALIWLLFESGMRTDPIIRVLNQVGNTKKADAKVAAKKLLESDADYLVIVRQPRGPAKEIPDKPQQETKLVHKSAIVGLLQNNTTA